MSTNNNNFVSYGFSQPFIKDAPIPIAAQRPPTTNDKAQLGTIWLDQVNDQGYVLISIENNSAMWEALGGAGGAITFDTDAGNAVPSGNVIDVAGGSNINTTGATNVVTVNLDNTVSISGSFTAGTTAGFITAQTGDITAVAGNINLPNTDVAATEGVITFGGNRFVSNLGTDNTFIGEDSGNFTLTPGSANGNTALGSNALKSLTTGEFNVALGWQSGESLTAGDSNVFIGIQSGQLITDGNANVLIGANAGAGGDFNNTTAVGQGALNSYTASAGVGNVSIGTSSLDGLLTGTENCVIGTQGFNGGEYEGSESDNVLIQNEGISGDNGAIRIGSINQSTCFIAGITGVTVTGSAVLCSATGQLGTVPSSIKYKENIEDLGPRSEDVLKLRPVIFNYKKDPSKAFHFGLIAEEVKDFVPELVLYNKDGEIETVAYHELPVLLLNELKKSNKRIEELEKKIEALS